MVVTALELLLGARADSSLVRAGATQASAQAIIRADADTCAVLAETGAAVDDGTVVVHRSVTASGRSRARLGGVLVPVSTLGEALRGLVTIHGQSDQQLLLSHRAQQRALDRFGGTSTRRAVDAYREAFDRLAGGERLLDELTTNARDRARQADLLRFGLAEIEAVDPHPGEGARLREEAARLSHVDALRAGATTAHQLLTGGDEDLGTDVLSRLAAARKAVGDVSADDTQLGVFAEQLAAASYALSDCAADIASYLADLEADPLRLAAVQDRLSMLATLTRKYGDSVDDVLQWARTSAAALTALEADDDRRGAIEAEIGALRSTRDDAAAALTAARSTAAGALAAIVTSELTALSMTHSALVVSVEPAARAGRDGYDHVEFQLETTGGTERRTLSKGASGGELARVMLALEVALAGSSPGRTMVFDEVDAGVAGKAAVEVGRRLALLARSVQVIVVTHLPQVAAFADDHVTVVKDESDVVTTSGVHALDGPGRRRELSRMLAGLEDSETALAHADELLEVAREGRPTTP